MPFTFPNAQNPAMVQEGLRRAQERGIPITAGSLYQNPDGNFYQLDDQGTFHFVGQNIGQPAIALPQDISGVLIYQNEGAPSTYSPPTASPATPAAPSAPAGPTTAAVAPLGSAAGPQPTGPMGPGSQTLFGPLVGTPEGALPQGLGLQWHELFGREMLAMMDASGTIIDPRTGAPITGPDGKPLPTQAAIKQAADIAAQQAQLRAAEYARAAAPNRAFENELARGATGMNAPVPTTQPSGFETGGAQESANAFRQAPVRVPAFINAFRTGEYAPSAGQFSAPSTTTSAENAALPESAFRLQNLRNTANLNPYQWQVIGSFGQGAGVTPEQQQYWRSRGMPGAGSATPSYAF